MPFLSTAIGAVAGSSFSLSGTLGTVGTVLSGLSTYQAARYQQAVAKANAAVAAENAKRAGQEAQQAQIDSDMQLAGLIGEQIAAQGASGLAVSSPTNRRVRQAARRFGRIDAQRIRKRGLYKVQNFQQEQANQLASAKMAGAGAGFGLFKSLLSAGGTFIGGARPTVYNRGSVLR